ncbi:MAG: D-2-hydroxyacid dehydrogenase [Acidobacteriia bacterium]|nr:D-2-hydroxyacid dehydrogenase [Terriglobia bacterium]
MAAHTLLVISDPADPQLAKLEALPPETSIAVGDGVAAFARIAPEADIILNWAFSNTALREVLGMCPRLQWVHTRTAGLDNLLFPELVESPVLLTNGRGVYSPALGEFAIAAILYFAKDLRRMVRSQQAGVWDPFDVEAVSGKTVGILGYGDIGRAVASRARALGMQALAVRRHAPDEPDAYAQRIFAPDELTKMLALSDYVVVAAPLTPETRGMLGGAEFAAMKPSAVVINVGRGPVIDEPSLVSALSENRIKGAALDVFDLEPIPAGHPFYRLENVLLSPHCADHTPDWTDQAMLFFLAQFERFRKGEPLLNVVDKRLGY